jgi:hypothetical protein
VHTLEQLCASAVTRSSRPAARTTPGGQTRRNTLPLLSVAAVIESPQGFCASLATTQSAGSCDWPRGYGNTAFAGPIPSKLALTVAPSTVVPLVRVTVRRTLEHPETHA